MDTPTFSTAAVAAPHRLAALTGHIDIEVRHGFDGFVEETAQLYRDHARSVMWLMGFTATPTPDTDRAA